MTTKHKKLQVFRPFSLFIYVAIVALTTLTYAPKARAITQPPSWWNGATCDTNNYPGSYALGASYKGVIACGPGPVQGGTDHLVNFYPGAHGEFEWECTELVKRYMYLVYGVAPYAADGKDVVNNYTGTALSKVINNGSAIPSPGDVISEDTSVSGGHTAVVTGTSAVDANGNGYITIMQQNASSDGWGTINVTGNRLGSGVTGWLHSNTPNGRTIGDWNNDNMTDASIFRPSDGTWHIRNVGDFAYGQAGDIPVPGDYDGNGTIEAAVYRPSTGYWYIRGGASVAYGQPGDIPVPADWNGDGTTDIAVYRPSDGSWHIRNIGDFNYGQPGDVPLVGDFDGNGTVEAAVFRASAGYFYVRGGASIPYGQPGDIPVPADYNNDHITDVAIFRPSDGTWHIRNVGDFAYGQAGDVPLVGDFDGNGTIEAAVYRSSTGYWYVRGGTSIPYGTSADIPVVAPLNAALLKQEGLISSY